MATKKFITDSNLQHFAALVKTGYANADTAVKNALTTEIDAAKSSAAGALAEAQKKIAKGGLKTINGQSLEGSGNIELDFTVAEVVTELPDVAKATKSKIYLVPSSTSGTNNTYAEYIKITVDGKDKWEKIGEYQANIDLTPYAKAADLDKKVDKVSGKQLSTNDYTTAEKTKLAGLDNYSLAKADGSDGGIDINLSKGSTVQNTVNIPLAAYTAFPVSSADGLMSGDDKKKLDTIAADYVKSADFADLSDTDIETLWNNAK